MIENTNVRTYISRYASAAAFLAILAAILIGNSAALTRSARAAASGKTVTNAIGMELVEIPAGSFNMGSPAKEAERDADEGPVREINIPVAFWMGKYEVTEAQYEMVMGVNPSGFRDCANCPVETVSWEDAQEFIKKLNAMDSGFNYRLPSEAEWEYAARAGAAGAYSHGESLAPSQANFDSRYPYGGAPQGQYIVKTEEVGSYDANAFGLHDMHGNVWEWVEDVYVKAGYAGAPTDGSANTNGDPNKRVRRGGGWDSWGKALRSANRGWKNPRDPNNNGGFRVVAEKK